MTTLVFNDGSWTVVAPAWSVAPKDKGNVALCYPWSSVSGPAQRARQGLHLLWTWMKFLRRISSGGLVDLRAE
jgi:hypothetical protein